MNDSQDLKLCILWDDSHIWGLIAVRAAAAFGLPYRIIRGEEIASGILQQKNPGLLLVPGGNARHKAESLGPAGLQAVRDYVSHGGNYLGFCGGAGLALTSPDQPLGLGICPWKRAKFDDRIQHFMSGHLHVSIPVQECKGSGLIPADFPEKPELPVWWPGRFAPQKQDEISILASYERPAGDFWLADLPIADLPPETFSAWKDLYGVSLTPSFLEGQPCVISGEYGKGKYILSYSHLETPDSPEANKWFAHLMRCLGEMNPLCETIPPWDIWSAESEPLLWHDKALCSIQRDLDAILENGLKHGMLFKRTQWLMGWRTGLPGANLNNLWAALRIIREKPPSNSALSYWKKNKQLLSNAASLFSSGCIQYLLAERLSQTVSKFLPEAVPLGILKNQREALFGQPMHAGGVYRDLMAPLDQLAFLQLNDASSGQSS